MKFHGISGMRGRPYSGSDSRQLPKPPVPRYSYSRPVREPELSSVDRGRLSRCADTIDRSADAIAELGEANDWRPNADSQAASEAAEAVYLGLDPVLVPQAWRAIDDLANGAAESPWV